MALIIQLAKMDLTERVAPAQPVLDILNGALAAQVMIESCEMMIFDDLVKTGEPVSAETLAAHKSLHVGSTERLLNTLVSLGLLKKTSDKLGTALYSNTAVSARYLTKNSQPSFWPMVMAVKRQIPIFDKLPEAIRTGCNQLHVMNYNTDNAFDAKLGFYRQEQRTMTFLSTMNAWASISAPKVVRQFDLSQFRTVSDIGGGSGAIAYELCRAYPQAKVTVLDLPTVVALSNRFKPVEEHLDVTYQEGDFFKGNLPPCDLALVCHVLHDWSDKEVDVIIRNVYRSIRPGGAILIGEKILNDSKDGPKMGHIYDIGMLLFTKGREWSCMEFRRMLSRHGFVDISISFLDDGGFYDVVFARKPLCAPDV